MKFVFDNNLPPALAHGLHQFTSVTHATHSAAHLTDLLPRNTPDEEWIAKLAQGDHVIVTQDRLSKGLEREALRRAGLLVFLLDRGWSRQKFWPKAKNLVDWWPRIIEQAEGIEGGGAFQVSWRKGSSGKFKQLKL